MILSMLLIGCYVEPLPPGCYREGTGPVGEKLDADGTYLGPAYECQQFIQCDDHAEFNGEIYDAPRHGPITEEHERLWCDRCTWYDEPILFAFWPGYGCAW